MTPSSTSSFKVTPLLFTTLVISICSMVYELLIGSLSSYLLGDSITQFSITIGLYLFAMGLGSYLSRYIEADLFSSFALIEILVGIIGGFSSLILFSTYVFTNVYPLAMYSLILTIGLLVGLEIPLLVRIIEGHGGILKEGLANLFAFDYLGGLGGSLLFPLFLLPRLGYVSTSFFAGVLNLVAAGVIVFGYKEHIKKVKVLATLVVCAGVVLVFMTVAGEGLVQSLEGGLYRDQIIYSKQTPYQKIVLTKHKNDLRLFLNGNAQFSSEDEYRYHEALVHVPMSLRPNTQRVLLLGAGDGLGAKELLQYPSITDITIVDLDKELVELCRTHPLIKALNKGALEDKRVTVVYQDAFVYIREVKASFDMIIVDLPDPDGETLSKLYSTAFYEIAKEVLSPNGLLVTQSSSPYYTKHAFWCINKTMGTAFKQVVPYHLYVPSFGDWGFNMASNGPLDVGKRALAPFISTSYINANNYNALFAFGEDEKAVLEEIKVNTLVHPVLPDYYLKDVNRW